MLDASSTAAPLVSELDGDPDLIELVETFVGELPDRVTAIRQALEHQDFETLQRLAHQLKGAAGGYGFPTITDAAKRLEATLKTDRQLAKMTTELNELAQLCARARATAP